MTAQSGQMDAAWVIHPRRITVDLGEDGLPVKLGSGKSWPADQLLVESVATGRLLQCQLLKSSWPDAH